MKSTLLLLGLGALVPLVVFTQLRPAPDPTAIDKLLYQQATEAPPLCPWRQTARDLKVWYPQATSEHAEVPILSAHLIELKDRLGRWPTPDENPVYLHRVVQGQKVLGTVLVRRVKGQYGAIEIVLAVDPDGKVRGLRFQRLRELAPIADALNNPAWLAAYTGKTVADKWRLGAAVPDVAPIARQSAAAVVEGVRSLLILLQVAEEK